MKKPGVCCCVVLILLLHCASPLPIKSETTTLPADDAGETTTSTTSTPGVDRAEATVSSTPTTLSYSTLTSLTTLSTSSPTTSTTLSSTTPTTASPSTTLTTTKRPSRPDTLSNLVYSPIQNLIKNVGYAFRIVLKMLAPLFGPQKPAAHNNPEQEYEDFDDQAAADEEEDLAKKSLQESFLRTVRQVAEVGRQATGGYAGYYDFIVNEYSYKFWAVYMLFASGLLIYSAIAAIYYAKFNTSAVDYATYDEARADGGGTLSVPGANPLGLLGSLVSVRTFQTIMDSIAKNKFEDEDQN